MTLPRPRLARLAGTLSLALVGLAGLTLGLVESADGLSVAIAPATAKPPAKKPAKPGGKKPGTRPGGKKPGTKPASEPTSIELDDEAANTAAAAAGSDLEPMRPDGEEKPKADPKTDPKTEKGKPPAKAEVKPEAKPDAKVETKTDEGKADEGKSDKADDKEAKGEDEKAQEAPPDPPKKPISLGILLGYGISSVDCGSEGCNPFGLGFGLRGGYTLPSRLYVGGTFVYHLGYTKDVEVRAFQTKFRGSMAYLGPEVGYDLEFGKILVRPYAGLGLALYGAEITSPVGPSANTPVQAGGAKLAIWPGATALYSVHPKVDVGADLRLVLVPGGAAAFALGLAAGTRF